MNVGFFFNCIWYIFAGGFENPGYITGPAPPPYYPPTTSQGVQSPPPYQQQPTEQPTAGVHQKY